jgi:hypothetical protein
MKKDKIYELKIEEDDVISGIDSISLVSEPAIEVNWVAFNKVKQEEFLIPDGEDLKYSEMITQKGHSEEELFNQGWKVHSTKLMRGDFVSSSPNSPSFEDTDEYLVRYKYVLNPEAPGSAVKSTTRDFCRDLISKNLVYRVEDLDTLQNDLGSSALVWRGSYNCRHVWQQIRYHKDTKIVNKGSVTRGRIDDAESYDVIGYPQPDTRVPEWPSFSKQKMEIVAPNLNIYGYHTRYFQICPGAQELFKHLISMNNDEDTIGMIRSAAQVADNIFRIENEVIKYQIATQHQYEEAVVLLDDFKDIINEVDKISGMVHDVSFMDGHIIKIKEYLREDLGYDVGGITPYVDELPTGKTYDTFETYNDYPESASNNACKVLKWREEHGDEVKGMTQVGWTRANQLCKKENISEETIARMSAFQRHRQNAEVSAENKSTPWKDAGYVAWLGWGGTTGIEWAQRKLESIRRQKMSKQEFQIDSEKKMVVGPAMVPDLYIPRVDKNKNVYYVYFTAETIKMIAEKYMRYKYIDNNDTEHNGEAAEDVYVVESWIKEDKEDKSNKYGYQDLPIGTWFVSMKVRNPEVWDRVKKGELKGFSVSGFFEEIEKFYKEKEFLKQLADLLKDID